MNAVSVKSEITKLKSVLLHRPGLEIENISPEFYESFLFDDAPYMLEAQREHDVFAQKLIQNGVKVHYIENLLVEVFDFHPELKTQFVDQFLKESCLESDVSTLTKEDLNNLRDYFFSFSQNLAMVQALIAGLERNVLHRWLKGGRVLNGTVPAEDSSNLVTQPENLDSVFVLKPIINILFQRDPASLLFNGIAISQMKKPIRNRETLISDYVFHHHPMFKGKVKIWTHRSAQFNLEGGDIMVLNKDNLLIGLTERTDVEAAEAFAKRLFVDYPHLRVTLIQMPSKRAYMHLDTVMTCIDYDKFIVHPLVFADLKKFKLFEITKNKGKILVQRDLKSHLEFLVGRKVVLIPCGGSSFVAASREQWNDGTNVLTISPGKVIAYSRNHVTNDLLRNAGIEVIEIPSSELSRGRGGPRCLSMPIVRED